LLAVRVCTGDESSVVNFLNFLIFLAGNKRRSISFTIRTIVLPFAPLLDTIFTKDCTSATNAVNWFLSFWHWHLLANYAEDVAKQFSFPEFIQVDNPVFNSELNRREHLFLLLFHHE